MKIVFLWLILIMTAAAQTTQNVLVPPPTNTNPTLVILWSPLPEIDHYQIRTTSDYYYWYDYTNTATNVIVVPNDEKRKLYTVTAWSTTNVAIAVSWDKNPPNEPQDYYIYFGLSSWHYTNRVFVHGLNRIVMNLRVGATYYVNATSVWFTYSKMTNSSRAVFTLTNTIESNYGQEVIRTVLRPPLPVMPTLVYHPDR